MEITNIFIESFESLPFSVPQEEFKTQLTNEIKKKYTHQRLGGVIPIEIKKIRVISPKVKVIEIEQKYYFKVEIEFLCIQAQIGQIYLGRIKK